MNGEQVGEIPKRIRKIKTLSREDFTRIFDGQEVSGSRNPGLWRVDGGKFRRNGAFSELFARADVWGPSGGVAGFRQTGFVPGSLRGRALAVYRESPSRLESYGRPWAPEWPSCCVSSLAPGELKNHSLNSLNLWPLSLYYRNCRGAPRDTTMARYPRSCSNVRGGIAMPPSWGRNDFVRRSFPRYCTTRYERTSRRLEVNSISNVLAIPQDPCGPMALQSFLPLHV